MSEKSLPLSGQETGAVAWAVKNLSPGAHELLCLVACVGDRCDERMMRHLLQRAHRVHALGEVVAAGLMTVDDGEVRIGHACAGKMALDGLDGARREELHYEIASSLYSRGPEELPAKDVVLMVSSFNQCIGIVGAAGRLPIVAGLNYQAGRILQQQGSLERAREFFLKSADLFKDCPRGQVIDELVGVYIELARVEYFLGQYDLAEMHLDYLLGVVADPVKRAHAFELKVTINNHLGRYRKVVSILRESLGELGLDLPLQDDITRQEVERLKELLALREGGSYDGHHADIEVRQAILRLLYVGGMGLHHTSDVLMRWAALQIILYSGEEAISGVKAIGCVSYGRMLIISGEIRKGYEFGLKGLEINDRLDDVGLRCRVYGVYAFYIQPWKKPFSESRRYLEQATAAGRIAGDLIGLYIIKTHKLNLHLISGLPLKDLPQWDFEESHSGRELTYYITHYQISLLKFLVGESAVFEMPRKEPSWLAAELTIREEKFYRNYVWGRYYFLFGHYALAAAAAEEADRNRKLQEGSPLLPANLFTWFLSVAQTLHEYTGQARQELSEKLDHILDTFTLWRNEGPDNYEAPWLLLSAESARIRGDRAAAIRFYERSADTSGSNVYHFAVTHELWARYLLTFPEAYHDACGHLEEAVRAFIQWGAVAKARQLERQFEALLADRPRVALSATSELDIETIQYELSGDMEVASLLKKLMVLLLRITGSSFVTVELVRDTGERILRDELSLLCLNEADDATVQPAREGRIPSGMIQRALRSQQTIVVNDLEEVNAARDMEALRHRGVRSLMILPVTIHGHLSMVIYLETIFSTNWYLPERVRLARITANQGSVIIENARTHERSVRLNEEIRREMAEKERLASVIEAQKDAHLRELVQTQDNERKRIASDLHDSLGSMLSTVKLRLNGLQEDFQEKVPEKLSRFHETIAMLDESIHELRQIAHNMLPVSLVRFGLSAALETFVAQINAARQLEARLHILGLNRRLPEQTEVAIYRICQELVQNVIKHARASLLTIQIIDHSDTLNIIVEDNGIGMRKDDLARGFGFSTIQSKVNLLKGSFEIESQPGKGSMVLVDLPV